MKSVSLKIWFCKSLPCCVDEYFESTVLQIQNGDRPIVAILIVG